jgi:hypothetical protein
MRRFAEAEIRRSGNSKFQPRNSKEIPNIKFQLAFGSAFESPGPEKGDVPG